jgi:hypothetical protein
MRTIVYIFQKPFLAEIKRIVPFVVKRIKEEDIRPLYYKPESIRNIEFVSYKNMYVTNYETISNLSDRHIPF